MNNDKRVHVSAWVKAWAPPLIWMGFIFFLSSQSTLPSPPDPLWNTLLKKTGHAVAYALLAWLYARAFYRTESTSVLSGRLAWGAAMLYAITDEFHQGLVPGRHPTVTDGLIDALGAGLGVLLWMRWVRESHPAAPEDR